MQRFTAGSPRQISRKPPGMGGFFHLFAVWIIRFDTPPRISRRNCPPPTTSPASATPNGWAATAGSAATTAAAGDARRSGSTQGEYVTRYGTALLVATRITPEEPGLPASEAGRLILPERQRLERLLLEMEGQYGGRSFAYVGTCIHCPEGSCTRPGRQALPPSGTGAAVARSLRVRRGAHGLRTVRNRAEVGQRGPHAREYLTLVCGFFHDAESVVWNG